MRQTDLHLSGNDRVIDQHTTIAWTFTRPDADRKLARHCVPSFTG